MAPADGTSARATARARRTGLARGIGLVLCALAAGASAAGADVYPTAPQSPSANNGWVDLPPASSGYVDPVGLGYCRYVTNNNALQAEVPISLPVEWQEFRGDSSGNPPPGIVEQSCCRPQSVTLCQGAPGGTVQQSIGYTIAGQQMHPTATCLDSWGLTYTDTQAWSCNSNGAAEPFNDAAWSGGTHSYVCAPNAHTTACSASCGGGTRTTYNSCGDVQAVTACNTQACCTPNVSYSVGACSASCGGGSQTVTWYNSCGQVSAQSSQSCNTQSCCAAYAAHTINACTNFGNLVQFYDSCGNPSPSHCDGPAALCTAIRAQAMAASGLYLEWNSGWAGDLVTFGDFGCSSGGGGGS